MPCSFLERRHVFLGGALLVENGHGATSSDRTERLGGTARLARGTLHMAVTRLTKYAFHHGFAAPLAGLARRRDEPVSPGRSHPEHPEPGRRDRDREGVGVGKEGAKRLVIGGGRTTSKKKI